MNEQSPWEVGQVLQVPTSWGLGRGSVWLKGGDRESQLGAVSQVPVDRRTVDPWWGGGLRVPADPWLPSLPERCFGTRLEVRGPGS